MESLKIRPYARLITMLGDQLIKDETIALIELIKNSYDADAENVVISLDGFNSNCTKTTDSVITINDDGNGMDSEIIHKAWLNPATPEKLKRKKKQIYTDKGRIIQGEKGIGRFAIFKLGAKVEIITRRQMKGEDGRFIDAGEDVEYVLSYDFTKYDENFLFSEGNEKDIFLDELTIDLIGREPKEIIRKEVQIGAVRKERKPYGTIIRISCLKGKWNQTKLDKVCESIYRLQPVFGDRFVNDFDVSFQINGNSYLMGSMVIDDLQKVLDEKSVFIVGGIFDSDKREYRFEIKKHNNVIPYTIRLDSPEILGINPMKKYLDEIAIRKIECGSFSYKLYILDLDVRTVSKDTRYYLDPKQIESIKAHRVYLYRDGIRVMPYGDPEDDWLMLDMLRGTESAKLNFANDQIVGYISISQKGNPLLVDKTNREGLIEEGFAKDDLIKICQLLLRYLRAKPYAQYLLDKKNNRNREKESTPTEVIKKVRNDKLGEKIAKEIVSQVVEGLLPQIEEIKKGAMEETPLFSESNADSALDLVNERVQQLSSDLDFFKKSNAVVEEFIEDFERSYQSEKDAFENRIVRTENLAAIGLSAETAYHDARILLLKVNNSLGSLLQDYKNAEREYLVRAAVVDSLEPIKRQLNTVTNLMNNVQRLFPSTRSKKEIINVDDRIKKVRELYAQSLEKNKIKCSIVHCGEKSEPLRTECTDSVLLQVFINLFDNALYWLKTVGNDKQIEICIDSNDSSVLFSDSGPGVNDEDAPYIFEAFYSCKGEDGKGLGLYIARQLLERYGGSIELVKKTAQTKLCGAKFLIRFRGLEDNESK